MPPALKRLTDGLSTTTMLDKCRRLPLRFRALSLALLVLFSSLLRAADAVDCYQCKGSSCKDGGKKTSCKDRFGEIVTCVKADMRGKIVRGCGIPGVQVDKCEWDQGVIVCVCTGDLCNSAPTISKHFGYSFAVAMALLVAWLGAGGGGWHARIGR